MVTVGGIEHSAALIKSRLCHAGIQSKLEAS